MKSILNFLSGFFIEGSKKDYIGLSSFKSEETKNTVQKDNTRRIEKTALTGLLKRVG